MRYGSKGLTLLELLVVLLIVSLGTALLLPRVPLRTQPPAERRFVRDFLHVLRRAGILALREGKVVSFVIDPDNRTYGIEGEKTSKIPLEVEIRGEGGERLNGKFFVYFFPDGSATATELTIRCSLRRWALRVHPVLGTVSITELNP